MKKFFLTLCLLISGAILHAATETVNGIEWTYQVVNGEAEIYKGNYSSAIPSSTSGAITIPATLSGYRVTSIGSYAFFYCSNLTSVTILEGVTSIGDYTFYGCVDLISVTIPEGVTSIGNYAFYDCESLTSMTIPLSVTSIGDYTFSGCRELTSFLVNSENQFYAAINGLLCSKDGKTLIACPVGLTSVTIPSSVTSIGDNAFFGCLGLTSVTIPEGVTEIGSYAFFKCESLTSVTIPEGVISIGDHAIAGCTGLTSVTIPKGVTSIGSCAFYDCWYLTSVDFKGKPPSVGSDAFYDIPSSATGTYLPQYASAWESVIVDGEWNGLTMVQKEVATLPEGLPEVTGEWLTNLLEAQDVTSGSVTLASGTTVNTLEAARLLGITPNVTRTSDGATVAAESSFEVSEVVVADNAVSLAVTIAVEAGTLPSVLSLGGSVKLMVCDTLGGEWIEVTPSPSQIKLTRVSENKATLSVTQNSGSYKFFQVLVK